MTEDYRPADHASRRRIAEGLHENLFVEAGAGTGKTTMLVTRIVNLIKSGRAAIDSLAAITFTDMAAAELRDRVRHELEKHGADASLDEMQKERCLKAAAGMDGASIQTLHSFAGALLREKPLEAGLPPNFSISDAIEADIRFEEKWQEWLQELQEPPTGAALLRLLALGLKPDSLRNIASALHDSYDRLDVPAILPTSPSHNALREITVALPLLRRLGAQCRDPEDKMALHLSRVIQRIERLAGVEPGSDYALSQLRRGRKLSAGKAGQKDNWGSDPEHGPALAALRGKLGDLEAARQAALDEVRQHALAVVVEKLRLLALGYAQERRSAGRAEFHDLLVWARNLLRDKPAARLYFQRKYSQILIDEFQDTDPIQAEIAFYLASGPTADGLDLEETVWTHLTPLPGKLFVVGDPKQSIYRFRRADIASVDMVRGLMSAGNAPLTHNFRSQEPVIAWVNHVFSQWMQPVPGVQAGYLPLEPAETETPARLPRCAWRTGGPVQDKIDDVRRDEYREAVLLLHDMRTAPWQVRGADGALRPAAFRDICILMPTRTGLDILERALEDGNIPYRIESQSYILGTQDIQELLNCLRAIDSPADKVALVGALRSPAFACSDVDLLEHVEAGRSLDYLAPTHPEGRVSLALGILEEYHRKRAWTPVDRLVEDFIQERALQQGAFSRARPREKLRRLRMVVDLARSYAAIEGNSLRGCLDWIDRLAEEKARMQESPVPDTDEDAVRIMTIHAAKGLEFPIVMMLGLNIGGGGKPPALLFDRLTGRPEAAAGSVAAGFRTAGYDALLEAEEEADEAEGVRLMYVAATRARDHLVVSLWRKGEKCRSAKIQAWYGEKGPAWEDALTGNVTLYSPGAPAATSKPDSAEERARWLAERAAVIRQASRPAAVAVTSLVQIAKEHAGGDDAYYRTGRGGTSTGRAVHSVLQIVDLATGAGLDDLSKALASGEGIGDKWREVAKLARNGLNSAVVRRAVASGNYHREVFVSAPLDGVLTEGFIDLIFEEPGGLVIADYKTDNVDDEAEFEKKRDKYELQSSLYAQLAEKVTGKMVKEVVLVFLRSGREIMQ